MADPITTPVVLTKVGRKLLGKVLAGAELKFTKVVAGDGYLPDGTNVYDMTDLISPKKELPIFSCIPNAEQEGEAVITSEVSNAGVTQGFFLREAGIYAMDPDDGEILYSYKNEGDESSYLPGEKGPDLVWWTWDFAVVIDQAENVTAIFSENAVYVTRPELEARIDSLFAAAAPIFEFWTRTNGTEKVLRPVGIEDARKAILGEQGEYNPLLLQRKVEHLENTVGEVLLALEAYDVKAIYPDYVRYIIEDFVATEVLQVDLSWFVVTSIVAGDQSLEVQTLDGIIPWSWYTLSDGIHHERICVRSCNVENGIRRLILTAPIQHTYLLSETRLYRSSATVRDGQAFGPIGVQTQKWDANTTWQGENADTPVDFMLPTNLANAGKFEFSDSIGFTADGLVTLAG
jgi:hypothetical protein